MLAVLTSSLLKCWKLAGEDILDDGFPDVVLRPLEAYYSKVVVDV